MLVIILLVLFGGLLGQSVEADDDSSLVQPFFKRRWTRATSSRPCIVVELPKNGNYTVLVGCQGTPGEGTGCWVPPGQTLPHRNILSYSCAEGYHLRGHDTDTVVSLCSDGSWSQHFPECQKLCEPLASPSVEVKCVLDGKDVPCNKYMEPNTRATANCREHFKQIRAAPYSSLKCLPNGEWDHPLFQCTPNDCGVPVPVQGTTDDVPSYSRFPWTAVIYNQLQYNDPWTQVCLGNLISPRLVLTGARCLVSPSGMLQPREIRVGLGKYEREYSTYENHSIIANASELLVPPYYTGAVSYDVGDVGLIVLAQSVELSGHIMPVCLDGVPLSSLSSGNIGYVSGWNESQGETILSGKMNFVDHGNCKRSRRVPLLLLTYDKFCAEGASGISVVGKGDRGGGLTIMKNGKHFVVGVLSSKITSYQNTEGISLFTDISSQRVKKWYNENKARLDIEQRNEECKDGTGACNNLPLPTPIPTPAPAVTTTSPKGPVCKVPNPANYRHFTLKTCPDPSVGCTVDPGDTVGDTELLIITCSPGFSLVQGLDTTTDRALTSCSNGAWEPSIPQCYKLCRPLVSLTVDFQCWYGPQQVSCDKPLLPKTLVKYSCKEYHVTNNINQADGMRCDNDGEWTRPIPYCTAKCGLSNLNSVQIQSAILGSNVSDPGNFPWHSGIYHKKDNNNWEAVCGGTLVNTRWILTAAHCVTKKSAIKPPVFGTQEVMVSLGKNLRDWNAIEENGVKQRIELIWVHDLYVGSTTNFGNDIALLKMVSDIQVNNFVMPACLDYKLEHLHELREDKTLAGYVAGWGNTEECETFGSVCNTPSETLKYAVTTIINYTECFKTTQSIRIMSFTRLTTDKYCTGNGSESVVQQGDSGGGLTFLFGGLHYVYGVVSTKLKLQLDGKTYYNFGAFTSVTDHLDVLKAQLY